MSTELLINEVNRLSREVVALHQQLEEDEKFLTLLESANQANIKERDEAYLYIGRLVVKGEAP